MVVFDSTILLPMLWPEVPPPANPDTGEPVSQFRERIDHLVANLERGRSKIIIPTPVLSEILVHAGSAGPEYLNRFKAEAVFRVVAFDERAAVEVAAMTKAALDDGNKRSGVDGTWAKIKFDRQIVAIAKVESAAVLYSDDPGVRTFGGNAGLSVIATWELPLPPSEPQGLLELEGTTGDVDREDHEGQAQEDDA